MACDGTGEFVAPAAPPGKCSFDAARSAKRNAGVSQSIPTSPVAACSCQSKSPSPLMEFYYVLTTK